MTKNTLKIKFYSAEMIKIRRGNSKLGYSNAKPVFLLALIDCIRNGSVQANRFPYDKLLFSKYRDVHDRYDSDKPLTPIYKPFYYLSSDKFWHIKWKEGADTIIISNKNFRVNVLYASLDNALWDLLQNEDARKALEKTILENFLESKH